MTIVTDAHADIDNMMYLFVQSEIDLPTFEIQFTERWPDADRQRLSRLCGLLERDEMPWQDLVDALAGIALAAVSQEHL